MTWKGVTNEEALKAWDRGDPVWTCDMGGMGPGYEQCIQLMGFEFLREMIRNPFDWEKYDTLSDDEKREEWRTYCTRIEKAPAISNMINKLNPSGAQFGAAKNIASVFLRNGYSGGMEMVPERRQIQVSKISPTL